MEGLEVRGLVGWLVWGVFGFSDMSAEVLSVLPGALAPLASSTTAL
jgi:hypothetical protein